MKKHILAALILSSLSINAFALPQSNPQPLLGEKHDSSIESDAGFGRNLQTEGGADRLQERLRVAEDGADRVGPNRIAEGGADRLQERLRVAEDGADRVGPNRVAEGGADRLQERLRVAADGADRTPGIRLS
jgi:hypothetical protein